MFIWTIGIITLSILIIFVVHQIYEYFKYTLSKPIERNILQETKNHYEQIYKVLSNKKQDEMPSNIQDNNTTSNMESELMHFISDLDSNMLEVVDISQYENGSDINKYK